MVTTLILSRKCQYLSASLVFVHSNVWLLAGTSLNVFVCTREALLHSEVDTSFQGRWCKVYKAFFLFFKLRQIDTMHGREIQAVRQVPFFSI